MYTANPKWVPQAQPIARLSYEEAMELSHFGAKVLYAPTIQPVLEAGIDIHIKNTFAPEAPGTVITQEKNEGGRTVRGITHIDHMALLSLEGPGMVGIPGISERFFGVLSQADISIVLITQASSEHSICVGIAKKDMAHAATVVNENFADEIARGKIKKIFPEDDLAIVALVGDKMKHHQGLSGKMLSTLGRNNVNIRVIAQGASERNISCMIAEKDIKKALNALHEEFFEPDGKQLNLFVMGTGNVGAKFLAQLLSQEGYLKTQLKLNIRVIGLSNSRKMVFQESGIELNQWQDTLSKGQKADPEVFFQNIKALNLRNSIFVDNTANASIADTYKQYLAQSISVVTCNKIACSSNYSNYRASKTWPEPMAPHSCLRPM